MDSDLQAFYRRLLAAMNTETFRGGEWRLCERSGWPDNQTFLNLVAWTWCSAREKYLVVANPSGARSQCQVKVPWKELKGVPAA